MRDRVEGTNIFSAQQPDPDDHEHAGQRDTHHGVTRAHPHPGAAQLSVERISNPGATGESRAGLIENASAIANALVIANANYQ
ncbi:MAG TPA: hypothetical protein VFN27_04710 [Xanthobacteraceae bacterium]|nr:hypothetical protein [Xanthobacteraceae bacterium]